MSEWKKIKLSECCSSIADGDHQPPPKAEAGIPFVTISNMTSTNQFDFSDTLFVPQDYYDKLDEKRKARKDDILYSVVGSFGIPVFMKEDKAFVFQRHIAILRPDNEKIVPRFLFYTMLTKDFYAKADAAAIGAAQRTVSLTALRNMEIDVPDKLIQSKIGDTLATYDDLIENNQKQIKLLEEAAQRLYKEWFVDFRFPGHEDVEIVDGIPKGWREQPIDDVFSIKYGKTLPTSKISSAGKYPVYGANGIIGYYSEKNCDDYKVLITSRGNGSGDVLRTYDRESFVTNNSFVVTPVDEDMPFVFIHQLMKATDFKTICTGSAQPQLTNNSISTLQMVVPTKTIVCQYGEMTAPMYKKIESINYQIRNLSEARDRLLPKLMSGEIEVGHDESEC